MIVVDASAAVEVLLHRASGERLTNRLLDPEEALHAPTLIDLEVANALRRLQAGREMSPTRAQEALVTFLQLPLRLHPHRPYVRRIWDLRHNLTVYDAAYIALAEGLQAPLVTCDRKLAATPGHHARIDFFSASPR